MKFASLFGRRSGKSPRQGVCPKGQRSPARPGFRPELELLEGRLVPTTTLVVTNNSGDPSVVGSLPYEVSLAESNPSPATIVFASSVGKAPIILDTTLYIDSQSVAIKGSGQTISGNSNLQLFYVDGENLSLSNLTLENGYTASSYGGAIVDYYGNLSLTNVTFSGNQAPTYGGAIYVEGNYATSTGGAAVTISGCKFNSNSVLADYGGAIYGEYANFTINNTQFNTNTGEYGGALYLYDSTMTGKFDTFTGNIASSEGGAIADEYAFITLSNSTFTKNSGYYGGAVYAYDGGSYSSSNDTYTGNTGYYGGAIMTFENATSVSSDKFVKNTAEYGGAISNNGEDNYGIYAPYSLTVSHSTFTGNSAYEGGAISDGEYEYYALDSVSYSTFTGNTASSAGGAIFEYYSDLSLSHTTIEKNSATYGAGIFLEDYTATALDSTITGNTGGGGDVYIDAGTFTPVNSKVGTVV